MAPQVCHYNLYKETIHTYMDSYTYISTLRLFITLCVSIFACIDVYGTIYVQCPWRPDKGTGYLATGTAMVVNHHMGAGNENQVL